MVQLTILHCHQHTINKLCNYTGGRIICPGIFVTRSTTTTNDDTSNNKHRTTETSVSRPLLLIIIINQPSQPASPAGGLLDWTGEEEEYIYCSCKECRHIVLRGLRGAKLHTMGC